MKNVILWGINFSLKQKWVSLQDVETLLKQMTRVVGVLPVTTRYLHLRQLFIGETIDIPATDGTKTIAEATDVFDYIDSDFLNWGLDRPSKSTQKTQGTVYEMTDDGTFEEVYGIREAGLDHLCSTQSQIIDFAVNHKGKLRHGGCGTSFLFKKDDTIFSKDDPDNDNLFVANVYVRSDGRLSVYTYPFSSDRTWDAEDLLRFVFPQLTI